MRRKLSLLILTTLTSIVLLVAAAGPAATNVQADSALAGLPRLDGFHIYFSESLGEASRFDRSDVGLSRLAGLMQLYGADLYTLDWRTGIPADADLVVIAGPGTDLEVEQAAWLWSYLQNGGRLLLITDPLLGRNRALSSVRGFFVLMWEDMGLRARNDVVVFESADTRMAVPPPASVRRDEPTSTPAPPVEVPFLIANFSTLNLNPGHPITAGIQEPLYFFTARSLEIDETPREDSVTALVFSDPGFYGESDYNTYLTSGFVEYNIDLDTTRTTLPLAAALENIATRYRIVLIGDREFVTNGGGLQTSPPYSPNFLHPGNVRFLMRAVAWLLESDAVEPTFPEPGPTATPTTTPSPTPTSPPEDTGEGES
jgi:hypothetical protein